VSGGYQIDPRFSVVGSSASEPPAPIIEPGEMVELAFEAIIVRTFKDRRIVFWNRGAQQLYGWTQAEATGKLAPELLGSEYPMALETIEAELVRNGRWEGVFRQRHRDGHFMVVLARWALHRDSSGAPDAILEVNTDLTGQRNAETRLMATEHMFELLVSSVRDYAIFMLDPSGRVQTWNEGAQRSKGYTAAEIIGQHFSLFYPDEDRRAGKPERALRAANDEGRYEDEGWRVRKDGSKFWANVVITPVRDKAGVLRGYSKITRDMTKRRQDELDRLAAQQHEAEILRSSAQRLAEIEKVKSDFLNLASHELRGPVSVARGYLSLLLDGSLSPDQFAVHAETVARKIDEIDWMVRKMLETARLEHDQLQLQQGEVDLPTIIREEVQTLRPLLSSQHRVRFEAEPNRDLTVRADRDRVAVVIRNLLDNAIKYSPKGGTITVEVAVSPDHVAVIVADEGIGIHREDMPKLFQRFSRLSSAELQNISGTGLGLYLSREIARRHGGDITAESTPGFGSRFTLTLPRFALEASA
jgi:PAS domain S-box-containing protein